MIEFKQIIVRGTRTFGGKDYFTIYDFVKAYEHFNDPAWDGEPLPPEPPGEPRGPRTPRGSEEHEPNGGSGGVREPQPPEGVVVKLSDGRERGIRYLAAITYWSTDGRMITALEFMQQLFGDLDALLADEDELRAIWSDPDRREAFIQRLADLGHDAERLDEGAG